MDYATHHYSAETLLALEEAITQRHQGGAFIEVGRKGGISVYERNEELGGSVRTGYYASASELLDAYQETTTNG